MINWTRLFVRFRMIKVELSASADNTYLDLDYSGQYEKPNLINSFIIHCLEESNNKHIWRTA